MPQTMLAILSMVVTTLFAFNQHRSVLSTRLNMVREDMAIRSTGVAVDILEEIGSMPFDEATRDKVINTSSELTQLERLDIHGRNTEFSIADSSNARDIDDFNGRFLDRARTLKGKNIGFRAESVVSYINPTDNTTEVSYPTKLKKVTIKVYSTDIARPDTIFLSQLYACGSRCGW